MTEELRWIDKLNDLRLRDQWQDVIGDGCPDCGEDMYQWIPTGKYVCLSGHAVC